LQKTNLFEEFVSMSAWSRTEAARTIDEVKRRSATDPDFRALALSNPTAALAKVNPRPIPEGSVIFVESGSAAPTATDAERLVVPLPDAATACHDELSDEDLENAAGGSGTPPVGIS
jgi:hypothetical protein